MTTKSDDQKKSILTPQQASVADLLATGSSVTASAEAIGVARQTVSEWLNQNYVFKAELNRRRNELWRLPAQSRGNGGTALQAHIVAD